MCVNNDKKEKIKELQDKNKIMNIRVIVIFLVIAIIIIPSVVTYLTSYARNPLIQVETSNDWISFFGSYFGAIIGGIITLYVLYKTIKFTNENMLETIEKDREIQTRNECFEFCNKITELIGDYCSDISLYYYSCLEAEHSDNLERELYNSYRDHEISEETYNARLGILRSTKIKANRSKSISIYFKLQMLLKDEIKAKDVLESLETLHNTYDYINDGQGDDERFNDEIENLLEKTRQFIKDYKQEKIKY